MGHHKHHKHKHRSSSSSAENNSSIGGFDLSSALKNINLSSLASTLMSNVDIVQLLGILTRMASSQLKNPVNPQQFASPILKMDTQQPSTSATEEKTINIEADNSSKETQQKASPETQPAANEANAIENNPYKDLKIDPEKLSSMLNNLVNMLNSQQKT